jgi:transcriptional regulator with XRE-family HTH domain
MNSTLTNIGITLKNLREQAGFTQNNIANFLSVDQSLVSKIEKGERSITSDMLDRLSALFGIDTSFFVNGYVKEKTMNYSLRANDINTNDCEIISAIHRIALNCDFMTKQLKTTLKEDNEHE